MKFANFSSKDSQVLLDTCEVGCMPTLTDPSKVADKGTVPLAWRDVVAVVSLLTDAKKQALVKLLGLDSDALVKLIQDNSNDDSTTLATIAIGNVENDQRARLRSALQLVDTNVVIKGILADDRLKFVYFGGNAYGVQRLLEKDITKLVERDIAASTNPYRALNGQGSTGMDSGSNQWYMLDFASRKVFRIVFKYQNDNYANRRLQINGAKKQLTNSAGTYTYDWVPGAGYQAVTGVDFIDDGGRGRILDFQILYADATAPTLTNGQTLLTGDFFRVDGSQQILEFKGTHQGSGAWYAVPSSNNINIDSALSEISTNSLQNRVITAALNELRTALNDRIDAIQIVDELQDWIERQILFNAIVVNKIDDLYEKLEAKA